MYKLFLSYSKPINKQQITILNYIKRTLNKLNICIVEVQNEVLDKSGAKMLLDVNNVFVNAANHSFKSRRFIDEIDKSKVAYMHIAGHYHDNEFDMKIDSHGMPVCSGVWKLLEYTLKQLDAPIMIERDNNIPPLLELQSEYNQMKDIVQRVRNANW